jgi:hypothetical protein
MLSQLRDQGSSHLMINDLFSYFLGTNVQLFHYDKLFLLWQINLNYRIIVSAVASSPALFMSQIVVSTTPQPEE